MRASMEKHRSLHSVFRSVLLALTVLIAPTVGCSSPQSGRPAENAGSGSAGQAGSGSGSGGSAGSVGSGTAGVSAAGMGGEGADAGSFDAGSSPTRNMVQVADVCERLSTIQCAGEKHCCTNPGRTEEMCKSTMKDGCVNQLHLDAIAAQANTGFDRMSAETAFTEFERLASTCKPSIAQWGVSVTGFRGILKGTIAAGQSCRPPLQSLTDPVIAGAALVSCTDLGTQACLPMALSWTCTPRHPAGGACFADANCLDDLYCDNPQTTFGAVCKARKAPAAACTNANECLSLACKQGTCRAADDVQAAYCLQ